LIFVFALVRNLDLPQMQCILQEFEKQTDVMDIKEDMMNTGIEVAMSEECDEEERYSFPC
jgi:charged multivesicular body protein 2A